MRPSSRWIILAVVVVFLAPIGITVGVGLAAAGAVESSVISDSCQASDAGAGPALATGGQFDPAQVAYARIIYTTALVMKLPRHAAVIAITAALQDSGLVDLTSTDGASATGLFQEPPSPDWGSAAQLASPYYASAEFYRHLIQVPGWDNLPVGQAAQAAQQSGMPVAYARWAPAAADLVAAIHAQAASQPVGAPGPADIGPAIVAWADSQLGVPFQPGGGSDTGPTTGYDTSATAQAGWDCSGLTMYAVHHATNGKISLPHSVTAQFTSPHIRLISYSQLQPGDLVFLTGAAGSSTSPGQVAIYAGDQVVIDAAYAGAHVRFDSLIPGSALYAMFIAGGRVTL